MASANEIFRRRYAVNELHFCEWILRQDLIPDWLSHNQVDADVRSRLIAGRTRIREVRVLTVRAPGRCVLGWADPLATYRSSPRCDARHR